MLGLDPILLESAEGLFEEVAQIAKKYAHRYDRNKVRDQMPDATLVQQSKRAHDIQSRP